MKTNHVRLECGQADCTCVWYAGERISCAFGMRASGFHVRLECGQADFMGVWNAGERITCAFGMRASGFHGRLECGRTDYMCVWNAGKRISCGYYPHEVPQPFPGFACSGGDPPLKTKKAETQRVASRNSNDGEPKLKRWQAETQWWQAETQTVAYTCTYTCT